MNQNLIFLSHIHEEAELASLLKKTIEEEFSGFVTVFVSSDEQSIPAGTNFLKKIEEGLTNCIGALYLISPKSVKRNWISFELGAIWIRNILNIKNGLKEIPTIPICHSGIYPTTLPSPINNLNAVTANIPSQMETAFKSIQKAVGGSGNLRTNFENLRSEIVRIEEEYTKGNTLKEMFLLLIPGDIQKMIDHCLQFSDKSTTDLHFGFKETSIIQKIKDFEQNQLKDIIVVQITNPGTSFGDLGAVNGATISIRIIIKTVLQYQDLLLSN